MIRQSIAAYLGQQPLPFRYTAADLARELGRELALRPGTEYKRRHRELRSLGWVIDTYRDDPSLGKHDYRLVRAGAMP